MSDPNQVAIAYFEAWKTKDFDALASLLADDITFRGPLGAADDAASCPIGLRAMAESITDIGIVKMPADERDVPTLLDSPTADASPCPTVNWSDVESGKITRIRVTFDPRPLLAASGNGHHH